jgi:hypothetical protein
MGMACVTCAKEVHRGPWLGNSRERDHLEDLGVDGSKYKLVLKDRGWEGVDWIRLAQDRNKWHAVMNTVINFLFHEVRWIPWLAEDV